MQPHNQQQMSDYLLQMKMFNKQINREALKSQKQTTKHIKDGKNQLRKNNEESAKLHLKNAAFKNNQALNLQKMANKNQFLTENVKNLQNNQQIFNSFQKMGQLAQNMTPNFQNIAYSINNFQQSMDKMNINNKMMNQMMSKNMINDPNADQMLKALKNELAYEEKIKLQQRVLVNQKQKKIVNLKNRNNKLQI